MTTVVAYNWIKDLMEPIGSDIEISPVRVLIGDECDCNCTVRAPRRRAET